jgi:hypothetical protein
MTTILVQSAPLDILFDALKKRKRPAKTLMLYSHKLRPR